MRGHAQPRRLGLSHPLAGREQGAAVGREPGVAIGLRGFIENNRETVQRLEHRVELISLAP